MFKSPFECLCCNFILPEVFEHVYLFLPFFEFAKNIIHYRCNLSNPKLAKKMLDKYSDNQNYVTLSGVIIEYSGNDIIIECEELKTYITYEDEICNYYIYSEETLDLNVGDIIEFVTVPFHFYNGHKLPIVELKINGNTLLDFDDGKDNLIYWVNTSFK